MNGSPGADALTGPAQGRGRSAGTMAFRPPLVAGSSATRRGSLSGPDGGHEPTQRVVRLRYRRPAWSGHGQLTTKRGRRRLSATQPRLGTRWDAAVGAAGRQHGSLIG